MKIVLLEPLGVPEATIQRYAKALEKDGHTFAAYPKDTDPAVQIERAKDADVIMIANMPLRGQVIENCPNLKFIDVAFTGVDHVDLEAAKRRGVKVSNAAGYSTQAVAELALCMMLSLSRNVPQVEKRCREGGTKDGLVGFEIQGKAVGIVGAGTIGTRLAQLLAPFSCRVLAYSRHPREDKKGLVEYVTLDALLEQSDVVTLHCPLTDETRGMIGREQLAKMKPTALLINTARGPVVDAAALAEALNEGRIAGAGVDVFDVEPPLPAESPLLHSKNTLVTPHVAFASAESMEARAGIVFDNIRAWMDGNQQNIVL
ncbi:MAG: hydroxyacid dehydrogenase [Oscillospiraceae bacterium]|jgi:phosphoglycerate dehydrogenase-like enzyme|nr:hydroxyacid dehydrogenase [Oscillospiraceae bacterium]